MSREQLELVSHIRDATREMAKMADGASLDFLSYLLSIASAEATNLITSELAPDVTRADIRS